MRSRNREDAPALWVDHQIGRLQVTVDDALLMRMLERFGHVADHLTAAPHVALSHDEPQSAVGSPPQARLLGTRFQIAIGRISRPIKTEGLGTSFAHRHPPEDCVNGQVGLIDRGQCADQPVERDALDELHGHETVVLVLADVIDRGDAGMVESRNGPRLAPQSGDLTAVDKGVSQNLERNHTVQ